jgi:uncharacterized damage-inducible protein DinB
MKLQDALVNQFGMMYATAAANLEGMTHEDSLVSAIPEGNSPNWILGHLVNVHNGVMKLVSETPVWESEQLSRARWGSTINATNAIDWNTLREQFLKSKERCLSALGNLSDTALAEGVPDPFGGGTTRGELLARLAYHQAYHVGQLGILRRVAGREGKIKAPGQPR